MKVEVEKEKLVRMTKLAVSNAMTNMATLAHMGCPVPRVYENAEDLIILAEQLRVEAGVNTMLPAEAAKPIIEHQLSMTVASRLTPETLAEMADMPERDDNTLELLIPQHVHREKSNKAPMGFQIPEINKNKMN